MSSSHSTYTCRAPMITQDTAHDASTSAGDRYTGSDGAKYTGVFTMTRAKMRILVPASAVASYCSRNCKHFAGIAHWTRNGLVQQHQKQTARSPTPHHITGTPSHTLTPGSSTLHTLAIMGQNGTMPWLVAACTEPQ